MIPRLTTPPTVSVNDTDAVSTLQMLSNISQAQSGIMNEYTPSTPEQPPHSINITTLTPNSSNVTPLFDPLFTDINIEPRLWVDHIQDTGYKTKDEIPNKTYNQKQIPFFWS